MKTLTFDIMVGDKFYRTMHMPITVDMIDGYDSEQPYHKWRKDKRVGIKEMPNT